MFRTLRIGLGLLILAISIVFLVWGFWPVQRETRIRPVSIPPELGLAEERFLTLLLPAKIRVGEASIVRLSLAVKDLGNTDGESVSAFYETHQVIAEARFDLAGVGVRPSDLISAPISQGQTAVFYWTLRPNEAGRLRGTIWLYLRTMDRSTGQENREAISIQPIEIDAVKLLGLTANQARIVGIVGIVVGVFLVLPLFWRPASDFEEKTEPNHIK